MSNVIYVPYVIVEISEEDHWEEVASFYYNSHKEASSAALIVADNLREKGFCSGAKIIPSVYTLHPAK